MNKHQKAIFIWVLGILCTLVSGYFLGDISFSFEKTTSLPEKSPPLTSLSGVETLSGTFFISPGSLDQLESIYKQAHTSLSLEIYEFTEKRIKTLFTQLLQENVDIRLIMENKKYQQFKDTFKDIQQYFSGYANFHIQSDAGMKTSYVHSKFALIDSGFLIQTANLTHSSFFTNREYFFYSTHSGVYKSLATIFEKDWNGQQILLSDIHPNLLVCPINCRSVLEYLISSAKKSLYIQNQYIEDPKLIQLLEGKVDILGAKNIHIRLPDTEQNKLLQQKFGSTVVVLVKKPYIHAKMMLVDTTTLYLGSINFSANSMDNNREVGILLKDPTIISQFLSVF